MDALKAELKATKEENKRLQRVAERQAKSRSPAQAKSTPPPRGAAGGGGGGGGGDGTGSNGKTRRVRAPSSRLYNPRKLQEKAEKLAKKRAETELAKCSFRPKTKAASKNKKAPKTRGNAASNRLFMQAKRYQDRRASLEKKKGELEVQDCTFSPSIDEKSVRMASEGSGPKDVDTFTRLSAPRVHKPSETVRNTVASRHHTHTHAHTHTNTRTHTHTHTCMHACISSQPASVYAQLVYAAVVGPYGGLTAC